MSMTKKVVWAEGMFLGQQHFQLWENWQESQTWRRFRALSPNLWGLVDMEIDQEALDQGRFQLTRFEAILPCGRLVRMDGELPGRDLEGLSGDELTMHLALPRDTGVTGLAGYPKQNRLTAWRARYDDVPDIHDGERVREVAVAEPNVHILEANELQDDFVSIPVARLLPQGMGAWSRCKDFVPPLCRIDASAALSRMLRRIIDLGRAKARVLSERWKAAGDLSQAGTGQLAPYLCLDVLMPALARLEHSLTSGSEHPEAIYTELLSLDARLQLLVPQAPDLATPQYEHHQSASAFKALEERITSMLGDIVPSQVDGMRLKSESRRIRVTRQLNAAMADRAGLYLAIRDKNLTATNIGDFIRKAKVCAREDLESIVSSAVPGLRLKVMESAPKGTAAASGTRYLEIVREGDMWQRVTEHGSLAVFLPADHSAAEVELIAGGD
jgi:type VI secretion system protein ImpJ